MGKVKGNEGKETGAARKQEAVTAVCFLLPAHPPVVSPPRSVTTSPVM
jgi:hypothetical protein